MTTNVIEQIRHNAALVQSVARDELNVDVGFDRAGVEWLDGYVSRQHAQGDADTAAGLVSTLGSYFGECIVATFGGNWQEDEFGWGVRVGPDHTLYPFAKIEKHLLDGDGDSVLAMFDTIPTVLREF